MKVVGIVLAAWTVAGFGVAFLFGQIARGGDRLPRPSRSPQAAGRRSWSIPEDADRLPAEPLPADVTVALHGMAASSVVVLGGLETLRTTWADLPEKQRTDLLTVLEAQADMMNRMIVDLLHGASHQLLHALDAVTTSQLESAERILAQEVERRSHAER